MLQADCDQDIAPEGRMETVKSFVEKSIAEEASYFMPLQYSEKTSYSNYLNTYTTVRQAVFKIYEERSKKLFDKDFYNLDKEEYNQVRSGIPLAIAPVMN